MKYQSIIYIFIKYPLSHLHFRENNPSFAKLVKSFLSSIGSSHFSECWVTKLDTILQCLMHNTHTTSLSSYESPKLICGTIYVPSLSGICAHVSPILCSSNDNEVIGHF